MENTSADTVDEEALQIEKKRKRQQRTLIFISILVSLYLIAQLGMLFLPMSIGIKILLFITVTGIGGCFIYVAKSRYFCSPVIL